MCVCEHVRVSISMRNNHLAHALLTGPLVAIIIQIWVLPEYDDSVRGPALES